MARVLVIDDDQTIRQLIVSALTNAGHDVAQAGTGREGAMIFQHRPADLVITDLVMPDDSLETVLALRVEHPGLPFILISGLAANSPRTRDVAEVLQPRRMLPKPFRLADLLGVTAAVLAEQGVGPPTTPKNS